MNGKRQKFICLQDSSYKDELRGIKGGRSISSRSALYFLDPFMDKDGLLRVGGKTLPFNLSRL